MNNLYELLCSAVGSDCVLQEEPMKNHTTLRIGGFASFYITPKSAEDLIKVLELCDACRLFFYIVGKGSNLLVSDEGYRGAIINLKNMANCKLDGDEIIVQSGCSLSMAAKFAFDNALTGFEFAAGIPGTIGGAVVMNAGAYGSELKDVLTGVTVLTKDYKIRELSPEELELGYRTSCILKNGYIVLAARIKLKKGDKTAIKQYMDELAAKRREKQPLEYPSAGSTFKRPPNNFAGKLIMEAGMRGKSVGDIQVSEKHCGFVINKGNGTAKDFLELCNLVKSEVKKQSGVDLELEVKIL